MLLGIKNFVIDIYKLRKTIFDLAINDLKKKYLGSFLGIIWAFLQPLTTIGIFWFLFEVGFKTKSVMDYPFFLWLVIGMVPWFFLNESIIQSASSILENSHIVKKVSFRKSILPIVRIISAFIVNLFFIACMFIITWIYGYEPSIYNLQIIYYSICSFALVLSISWITSSLVVFIKDINHLIGMIMQFLFWLTPIFWSIDIVPTTYKAIFYANPLMYIIEGFRDSMLYRVWFFEKMDMTLHFWAFTCITAFLGILIFKKLSPWFADYI